MNTSRAIFPLIFIFFLSFLLPAEARAFKELSDTEMNAVTAGSVDPAYESEDALRRVPFHFTSAKGSVDGEVFVLPMTNYSNQGTLQLTDNAQSNLRSLINVNAVNSPVQILLNLNININSTIGNLNQINDLLSTQGVRP